MKYETKRRSVLFMLFYTLLVLVTVVSIGALLFGYCASWINPQSMSWLAFLGLGLQFLMLWNIFLLFVWMVILRWWAVVVALSLLVGIGFVGDFVQLSWVKHYHQDEDLAKANTLTVATYNVHSFGEMTKPHSAAKIKDSIVTNLKTFAPDIICFQEYAINLHRDTTKYDDMYSDYPYRQTFTTADWGVVKTGLEIRSRYPIKSVMSRQFERSENAFMMVDVTVGKDKIVRLFNCHLQSTGFNAVSPDGLRAIVENKDTAVVHSVLAVMNNNYKRRAEQADTVAKFIEESPYTVIVAGDFNDTPSSYVTNKVGGELTDSFRQAGRGYGSTYRPMKGLFRIDYVLYNGDSLTAARYYSPDLQWSDHRPVITKLIFNK